jgi:hypothetical protein
VTLLRERGHDGGPWSWTTACGPTSPRTRSAAGGRLLAQHGARART